MYDKKIALAYVTAKNLVTVTPDDAMRLTHINIAFGLVNDDCTLNTCQLSNIGYISEFRKWNPSIKIVLSVGGWGAGGLGVRSAAQLHVRERVLQPHRQAGGRESPRGGGGPVHLLLRAYRAAAQGVFAPSRGGRSPAHRGGLHRLHDGHLRHPRVPAAVRTGGLELDRP